ncbi:MAG: phosphodiester glycosidase family protein [Pyrinomonadaceae bacterium]
MRRFYRADKGISNRGSFLWILLLVLGLSFSNGFGQSPAKPNWSSVADGVEYTEMETAVEGEPVKVFLLRLDPAKTRIDAKLAYDMVAGTEGTSSIATRNNAIAAVNAGFFRFDGSVFGGDPAGLFIEDGLLVSEPARARSAVFIENGASTKLQFAAPELATSLETGRTKMEVSGYNRERKPEEVVIFNKAFGRRTFTRDSGAEIIVRKGRIVSIGIGAFNSEIPEDGFVVSIGKIAITSIDHEPKRNAKVRVRHVWKNADDGAPLAPALLRGDAVAGVSRLVSKGALNITWQKEGTGKAFGEARHPRTFVGLFPDGSPLLGVADGRQKGYSVGMTLPELGAFLVSIGVSEAMNLDGGGSSTMFLKDKIANKPSDESGERKVSDALVVTLRNRR